MNQELKKFIINQAGVDEEEVTMQAQIEDDLGVTGDDAVDFIIKYGKTFNVDVSRFMAGDYFGPERSVILSEITNWITGNQKRKRKTLTVEHLEKGVIAGRLDEEITNI